MMWKTTFSFWLNRRQFTRVTLSCWGLTVKESRARVAAAAVSMGWRPRKWWQVWRILDDQPDLIEAMKWFHQSFQHTEPQPDYTT